MSNLNSFSSLLFLQNSSQTSPLDTACAMSEFVADVLRKQPQLQLEWSETLPCFSECSGYPTRLATILESVANEDELQRAIRLFRQVEMAKLSILQSLHQVSPEQVFETLSDLAEAVILATKDWLYQRMCEDYGTPMNSLNEPQELIILGMGKLGGRELNFSSDIDLIFTYPDSGETIGARKSLDNQKFFTRLGQKLIKALDEITADGFAYRTDMRLRPFGDSGALVLSFAAMEDYYQEQGRDWERYAMIKVKILGEDLNNLNHRYLKNMLRPFVFRRYLDFSAIQSLREMKMKITREVLRRGLTNNIKLGAGGIREIEFIVQSFQLMRGGRDKALQHRSLLAVLPHLIQLDLLNEKQVAQLRMAYLFLRQVENVLQAIREEQTQTLPTNVEDQARLVWHFQYENWSDFLQALHDHQRNVRLIFDELIGIENEQEDDNPLLLEWQDILNGEMTLEDVSAVLTHYSVKREDYALIFEQMKGYFTEWLKRPIGQRGRTVLRKLLPKIADQIFNDPCYRILIPRIFNIVDKVTTRTTYLELLLEKDPIVPQLIKLCGQSAMIAEQIAWYPILLDEMIAQGSLANVIAMECYSQTLQEYLLRIDENDEEAMIEALRQFKQGQLLRIAAADILGVLSVMKISDHLTYLAEAIIDKVVHFAWRQTIKRFGVPKHLNENEKGFAIIGYGKLGGIELGYNSDLDLVFLYDAPVECETVGGKKSISAHQFYLKLVQKINAIFSVNTAFGVLYDIDMRLRPSGEAGLLVSHIDAYADYQKNEAWVWENQALVRARCIYGSTQLKTKFEQIRQETLMQPRVNETLIEEICKMREKMYTHLSSKKKHIFHLKNDQGGIIDIEFIAQYLVLAYANNYPQMAKWSDNVRIFDSAIEQNILTTEEGEKLKNCYTEMRNYLHHLNLLGEESEVDENKFRQERAFVSKMWQALLCLR